MMSAMGIDYILKGATEEDIRIVQNILDVCKGRPDFDSDCGKGKGAEVVSSETLDLSDHNSIGFDLCEKGTIKVKTYTREGMVYYDETDRKVLLEQLVLMFSGSQFADIDLADFFPVFEKKCRFSYIEYKKGELLEKSTKLLENVTKGMSKDSVSIFVQHTFTDISEWSSTEEVLYEEYSNILIQSNMNELVEGKGVFAVFISEL